MPASTSVTKQRYKVVVLGPPAVGKTALVRRLVDGSFLEGARQRGLDFYTCHITLRDDVAVTLQLWDLSDCPCRPEDDAAPLSAYIFNCQAVLFVYDVSDPESLEATRHALRAVEAAVAAAQGGGGAAASAAAAARPYMALVANKCDLQWATSEALARELAARHSCVRYTLSARSGQGISRAAVQLACDLAGVPLAAATEHAGRFQDPPTIEPEGLPSVALAAAAACLAPATGFSVARAATVLEASCSAGNGSSSGKFSVRAPAYQTGSMQDFTGGSMDKLGLHGVGPGVAAAAGGGIGSSPEPWRPISSSTTSSKAVTVIGKTDSLGLRARSNSPTLLQPTQQHQPAATAAAPAADEGFAGSRTNSGQEGPEDGGRQGRRGAQLGGARGAARASGRQGGGGCGWRALLCCLPARQRS